MVRWMPRCQLRAFRRAFLSLLLLAPLLAAAIPAPTVLRGHLAHPLAPQVEVAYGYNVLTHQATSHVTAQLDAQGNFRLSLSGLLTPQEVRLTNGSESLTLFLQPGEQLSLTLDAMPWAASSRFAGPGAAANTYLAQHARTFSLARPDHPVRHIEGSSPAQFVATADAYRQAQRTAFAAYVAQHPVSQVFAAYVRQLADFERASALLYYGSYHTSHPTLYPDAGLPATFYDFLPPLRPAQDSALAMHNHSYYGYLGMFGPLPPSDPLPTRAALLASTQAQFGQSRSRDLVLASYVYDQLSAQEARALAPLLADVQALNRDSTLAHTLRQRYAQALAISPGQPAPAFRLLDHTGKQVSLIDLRGQVVYLDFWGSWCHPCLSELPASLALRAKFAGRPVVFVYINVHESAAAWQQALTRYQLPGPGSVQLRSPDDQVPDAYQVRGYPSYWLLDRAGRIVQARAPRPSGGAETEAAIEAALQR